MKKETLQKFIEKYYLAGAIESVIWNSNGALSCKFVNDSQDLVGAVKMNTNSIETSDIGIYKTSQLSKLLTALDSDVEISLDGDKDLRYAISLSDKKTKAKFMLADPSVIKKAPDLKELPEWDIEIDISESFVGDFIKARNAVPEAFQFAINTIGPKVNFIINYSTINTNRITIECNATKISDISPIAFNADLFKEILTANRGMAGKLKVSSKGLMKLEFTDGEFVTNYFMVKQQIN